jgi:predicted GNAT superfamily acetyltransferase
MEDVRIREARDRADCEACVSLQRAVWGLEDLEITPALMLVSTLHAGALLLLAETPAGEPVGFAYAFPAWRDGRAHLHSDMVGVVPEHRSSGVGLRLKWAQREEAGRRGLDRIVWTYDPLQARNANLNLRRLGAVAHAFQEDVYGRTTSPLHGGLPTDRLWVRWDLDSPRVVALRDAAPPPRSVPLPDLPRINAVSWPDAWPVSSEPILRRREPALLLEIPEDGPALASADPRLAADWHAKLRAAFRHYFDARYVAADFAPTDDGGRRRCFYVLTR